MDLYQDRIGDDRNFQQTDSILAPSFSPDAHPQTRTRPTYSSGYGYFNLVQSNSPQQHHRRNNGMITRPEPISTAPNILAPVTPHRGYQLLSVPASNTTYSPDRVFHRQQIQNYPSPASDYHEVHQLWSQSNSIMGRPYDNQQWPQQQSKIRSPPSPHYLVSPVTPTNVFGQASIPDSEVHSNATSSLFISQSTFLPIPADHESSEYVNPAGSIFPSPCYLCDEIIRNENLQWVHYWTKHPPLASSQNAWTPKKCLWKGCRTKTNFATPKSWIVHVNYVHQKAHKCLVATCRAEPFGSPADLERHRLTKHVEPIFCRKVGCQARKGTNLRRKDKLEEHEATWHGHLMCDVPGCPRRRIYGEDHGFSKVSKLEEHKRQKHRNLRVQNSGG